MASSAKRRAVGSGEYPEDTEDSSDLSTGYGDSDVEGSESSDESIDEVVELQLEGHPISENHSDGIKKLLQRVFLKAHVNTAEMTDIIIKQNHVGTVVRQALEPEEDDDGDDGANEVFGFITALNLTERKGVQCMEEVKRLLVDRCEKSSTHSMAEQLEKILNDASKPVGLLLSERFVNVPPHIALPLYKHLLKEIVEAQETDKPIVNCHYWLMISKTCKEERKVIPAAEEYVFVNAEEEFFFEQAVMKFHYSVQEESDCCLGGKWSFSDVPMTPFRTVMLIPAERMPVVMAQFKKHLSL